MPGTPKRWKAVPLGPALSKAEAAKYLGLSERSLERLIAARKIRSVKAGARRVLLPAELDRFLAEHNRLAR